MFSLDRIVNNVAVLIDMQGNSIKADISLLPKGVKEGDMLQKNENGFIINIELTEKKQEELRQKIKKLTDK